MIRDGGGVGVVKVTGKPHPAGSVAWRAGRSRHEGRIGVSRDRVDASLGWWAWCGPCGWAIGPGHYHTWREAMAAAAAHADHHRRENAARARADELANTEGATE